MLSRLFQLLLLGIALLIALPSCSNSMRASLVESHSKPQSEVASGAGIDRLFRSMEGSFSSAEQHQRDPENYFDIRLEMKHIWPERTDGKWLYVEQAAAENLEKPYRQRVYCLIDHHDGSFTSAVFALPGDPLKWAGGYRKSKPLAGLTREDLTLRKGCSIRLRAVGAKFVGSTLGDGCKSSLRGAAYATSEVTVTETALASWDRGFDAQGKQVWGAENGPYVFNKLR